MLKASELKRMSKEELLDLLVNTAVATCSESYAADCWEASDWQWYSLMRECLLLAYESEQSEMTERHRGFLDFPSRVLAPHYPPGSSKQEMFESPHIPELVQRVRAQVPKPFPVDDCPLFEQRRTRRDVGDH